MVEFHVPPRVGLALGGGGVRGLGHIAVLELFERIGLRPAVLAGTSMGAIIAALYASGRDARAIRRIVQARTISRSESWRRLLRKRRALADWLRAMQPSFRGGGLLRTDRVLGILADEIRAETFEELEIPLYVVATDFWSGESYVMHEGPLLSAIQASIAVPGVFAPVERDGRLLVDGGVTNLVPYDVLQPHCDRVVAVHVGGTRGEPSKRQPTLAEAVLGAFDIAHATVLDLKRRLRPPDLLIPMGLRDIPIFDFTRIHEVLRRSAEASAVYEEDLRRWCVPPAPRSLL